MVVSFRETELKKNTGMKSILKLYDSSFRKLTLFLCTIPHQTPFSIELEVY